MTAAIVMPGGTRRMPCNAVFRIRDRHPRTIIPDGAFLFMMSSRTVHRAGPASHPGRRHPLIDDIPDAITLLDVIPGPPQAEPGIQRRSADPMDFPFPIGVR